MAGFCEDTIDSIPKAYEWSIKGLEVLEQMEPMTELNLTDEDLAKRLLKYRHLSFENPTANEMQKRLRNVLPEGEFERLKKEVVPV